MKTVAVRISRDTYVRAQRLARIQGRPLAQVIETALKKAEDEAMLHEYNAGMARVRSDPTLSVDYDNELAAWDATLADGLPTELPSDQGGSQW